MPNIIERGFYIYQKRFASYTHRRTTLLVMKNMKKISDRDKILLHLSHHKEYESEDVVPHGVCQRGISESIDLNYDRVGDCLEELIQQGLVKREARSVVGLQRDRKVYFPTEEGYEKAEDELRESLGEKEVTVKTRDGEERVRLEDIHGYTDDEHPMLSGLKKMNEDGLIDLTREVENREDIFVGREDELEKLKEVMQKVEEQGCSIIFVTGDAGVGKTRLVSEFKDYATSHGFEFLAGSAHYDTSEPYLPLREAFEEYMEKRSEDIEDFTSMALLGTSVGEKSIKVEDKKMFDAERTADWNKSTERVREIASRKPLLVLLDDMQWSDQATLQLLHYMMKELSDSPVLFIVAFRSEDVIEDHALVEFKRRMVRERLFYELQLEPLDSDDTRVIIEGEIGSEDPPDGFVELVHDTAEGNPLFIREVLKQMLEEGEVDLEKGEYPERVETADMLDVIDDIVNRRIRRLSDTAERVLYRAAVIGEKVPFELLTKMVKMDELDLLDHLDNLDKTGLIYEDFSSENFIFSHGLIHKAIFDGISMRKREKIHQLVAKGMRELYKQRGELENYYSDLAYHYEKGKNYGKAVENYYKAGQEAEEVYAHEDAIQMYQHACELLERSDEDTSIEKITVLEKIGDANRIIGEYEEAVEYYKRGIDTARKGEKKAGLCRKIAKVYEEKGDFDSSLQECEKGFKMVDQESSVEGTKLLGSKGWALLRKGEYDKAEDIFSRRINIAETLGDKKEAAQAQHDMGTVYLQLGNYEAALVHLQNALEMRKKIDDESGLASTLNNLGILYDGKGELNKALEYHKKGLDIDKKIGDKWGTAISFNNIGTLYLRSGELDKAVEKYKRSMQIEEMIGDKRGIASSLSNLGRVHLLKEEFEEALEHFEHSLNICEDIGAKLYSIDALSGLAETKLLEGDLEEAFVKAEEAVDRAEEVGVESMEATAHRVLGMVYREKEKFVRAEKEFQKGKNLLEEVGEKVEIPPLLHEYGLLLKKMGRKKEAERELCKAVQMADEMGMEFWAEKCEIELND